MYGVVFKEMGLRLPFLEFLKEIFQLLLLPHSQLHHNSISFICTFELVREYLKLTPTITYFFSIFVLQRVTMKDMRKS